MSIIWGGTTCTVVKWGSTICSTVYWGSTLVFPGNGGKVIYNGSTFYGPIYKLYSYSGQGTGDYITSGSVKLITKSTSSTHITASTKSYDTNFPTDASDKLNLSSYSYLIVEYTSSNASMFYITGLMLGRINTTSTENFTNTGGVIGSFAKYDISGYSYRNNCVIRAIYAYPELEISSNEYTITITKIIGS